MPSPHLARTLIVEQARNRQGCAARKVTGTTASTDIRSVQPIPRESPRTTSTRGLARGDSVPLPCGGVIPPAIAVDGDRIPGGVSVAEGAIKDGGNCGADRSVLPLAAAWPSLRPCLVPRTVDSLVDQDAVLRPSRRDGHASLARRFGHTDTHFSSLSSQMPIERYMVPSRNGVEEVRPGAGSGSRARRDTTSTAKVPVARRQSPRH